ncbi:hypothetical protein AC579_1728 [Pseudocercospora musae]|uniref:Uncharacterized protein n=1 Tax=Pseudocercospora musae TaxID=113226 RepID=A0A139IF87_9PEZI|nr:hypothetical protein AC579_1728 [Pseudocercospora musae]
MNSLRNTVELSGNDVEIGARKQGEQTGDGHAFDAIKPPTPFTLSSQPFNSAILPKNSGIGNTFGCGELSPL